MNDHEGEIDAFKTNGASPPEHDPEGKSRDSTFHGADGGHLGISFGLWRWRRLLAYFVAGLVASCGGTVLPLPAALLLAVMAGGLAEAVSR